MSDFFLASPAQTQAELRGRVEMAERAAAKAQAEQQQQLDEQQARFAQLTAAVESVVSDAQRGKAELLRLKETKEEEVRAAVASVREEMESALVQARDEQSAAVHAAVASAVQQKETEHINALQSALSAQADEHARHIDLVRRKNAGEALAI